MISQAVRTRRSCFRGLLCLPWLSKILSLWSEHLSHALSAETVTCMCSSVHRAPFHGGQLQQPNVPVFPPPDLFEDRERQRQKGGLAYDDGWGIKMER